MEVPGEEGVEFDKTSRVDFERLEGGTGGTLRSATASNDRLNIQFLVGTACRFNLCSYSSVRASMMQIEEV